MATQLSKRAGPIFGLALLVSALIALGVFVVPVLVGPPVQDVGPDGPALISDAIRTDLHEALRVRVSAPEDEIAAIAALPADAWSRAATLPTSGSVWLRFELSNPGSKGFEGLVVFKEALLGGVEAYRIDGARPIPLVDQRVHRICTVQVQVPPQEIATFIAKVHVPRLTMPVELWTPDAFADAAAHSDWALGLLLGLFVAISLYYFAMAIVLGTRVYLPFTMFSGCAALTSYVALGFGGAHFGDPSSNAATILWPYYALGTAALTYFGRTYLELDRHLPSAARRLRWVELGLLSLLVMMPFGVQLSFEIVPLMCVTLGVVFFYMSLLRSRQGASHAWIYLAGWFPFVGLAVVTAGRATGVLSWGVSPEPMMMTAVTVAVLVLAYGMAERTAFRRVQREAALAESEQRYAYAARGSNDGLVDWNLVTKRVFFSPRFYETVRLAPGAFGHDAEPLIEIVHADERATVQRNMRSAVKDPAISTIAIEFRGRLGDGSTRWLMARALIVRGEDGRAVRLVGSISDIHDRKLNELKLERKAFRDEVTGLANRARASQHLQTLLEIHRENPDFDFGVLFIDLDRFKHVNDSLGHIAGDELLATLGRRLSLVANDEDMVGRLGGDEFVIVLPGRADAEEVGYFAQAVLEALEAPVDLRGIEVRTSASIGITHSSIGYTTVDAILSDADLAMYEAKRAGKGRFVAFDASMRERAMARLSLEAELRGAIQEGELEVFYQPIIKTQGGGLAGFEALIRWRHPRRGLVSPADFIPVAEETGLIRDIGRIALQDSVAQLVAWTRLIPAAEDWFMTVNVSPAQFGHDLLQEVSSVLEGEGLEPGRLHLEITEGLFIDDPGAVQEEMEALADYGVHFSLDDFGTGYSSMSYLHRLPFKTLKIDRSFINNLLDDAQSEAIVRSVLAMAKGVGLETVAEGVETEEVANRLRELGSEFCQGYLFGRPLPASELESMLIERCGLKASA